MKNYLSLIPFLILMGTAANAQVITLNGNHRGVWSNTHPHILTGLPGIVPPHARRHELMKFQLRPLPESEVVEEPVEESVAAEPEVCPTFQSAPHLCETNGSTSL